MPKPSALSALSVVIFCGVLILLVTPSQAAGQGQDSEKAQTENVRPQFHFNTGGSSSLRMEQQTPATVPPLILPPAQNFTRFAQTGPVPLLNTSNPFNVQLGQAAQAVIPKVPNALPLQAPLQQNLCSVPLLRVQPDPSKNFTIGQAPAPPTDPAMVVKPLAPSCDEKTSVQKPGLSMPPPSNRR
jgi:hypothetical protein